MLLILFSAGCASTQIIKKNNIQHDVAAYAHEINQNPSRAGSVIRLRIGKSGIYYVLNSEGVVIAHPNAMLCGRDFSQVPYVPVVLKQRTGFISQDGDGMNRDIYFAEINESAVLCFAIDPAEVSP